MGTSFFESFAKWMLENPTPSKIKKISEIAYETPPYVAALTNETASYADYENTLVTLAKKRPLFIFVRNDWEKVVGAWVKKYTPKARFSHMGKHLMFWENHVKFNQKFDSFLDSLD